MSEKPATSIAEAELDFLVSLFPDTDIEEVRGRFSDIFGGKPVGNDQSIQARENQNESVEVAIAALQVLVSKSGGEEISGFEFRRACKDIPCQYREYASIDEGGYSPASDRLSPEKVRAAIDSFAERLSMSRVWDAHNPRPGGKDNHAYGLAEAIADVFEELGEPILSGTAPVRNGKARPSTKFGKVVQRAFKYHSIDSNWIAPHRAVSAARRKRAKASS